MTRRNNQFATVALANKTAQIVWSLMTNGERYRQTVVAEYKTRRAVAYELGKREWEQIHQAG